MAPLRTERVFTLLMNNVEEKVNRRLHDGWRVEHMALDRGENMHGDEMPYLAVIFARDVTEPAVRLNGEPTEEDFAVGALLREECRNGGVALNEEGSKLNWARVGMFVNRNYRGI